MSIADARVQLVDALDALDGVDVLAYPSTPEQLQRSRCVVAGATVTPTDTATTQLVVELTLWVVSHLTGPAGDAHADDLLEQVLHQLDRAGIAWTQADPGVWGETNPGYRVMTEMRTA